MCDNVWKLIRTLFAQGCMHGHKSEPRWEQDVFVIFSLFYKWMRSDWLLLIRCLIFIILMILDKSENTFFLDP